MSKKTIEEKVGKGTGHEKEMAEDLSNLSMNKPLKENYLLEQGAFPQKINGMNFLVIKSDKNYFTFVKKGENYYKW